MKTFQIRIRFHNKGIDPLRIAHVLNADFYFRCYTFEQALKEAYEIGNRFLQGFELEAIEII